MANNQYAFGSGSLWAYPLANIDGSVITTPTPAKFGILQDVSFDIDMPDKPLHGTFQFPVAVGRGKAKVTFKAKLAQLNAALLNDVIFAQVGSPATGQTTIAEDESGVVGTLHVTVAHGSTMTLDLGVIVGSGANAGTRLQAVASSPVAGVSYIPGVVSTGQYTFAAGDNGVTMLISYEYTVTGGQTIVINNQLLGNIPSFRTILKSVYAGQTIIWDMYNCTSNKFAFSTKLDDWAIPEFDIAAYCNSANVLGLVSMVNA